LEYGIEINTPDLNIGREVAFDLHLEGRPLGERERPRYLIALENPNINKHNADGSYCQQFDKAFAWDKRLHHLPNVVPILIPHPMVSEEFPSLNERPIFSCLINANKAFKEVLPTDLYLERLNTIRWYEKHAPEQFELYGMGWEKSVPAFTAAGRLLRLGSRLKTRLFGLPPSPAIEARSAIKQRSYAGPAFLTATKIVGIFQTTSPRKFSTAWSMAVYPYTGVLTTCWTTFQKTVLSTAEIFAIRLRSTNS